ncbi:hypothetical protein O3G_MSEX011141 [Manduca sexta]|uniref:Ommochrome-binding protein n=1 Tax=Manduca sexta TaxID=7130 RepID=A0A922CUM8_MANSE|nr:hypothetical protein O3G_MSEX011141 [Manduca sexta]KAG6458977.1 hypothetical protein O3G_MSEX011141 [Manduca sexta]
MKLLILAVIIATVNADDYCHGIYINDKYYNVDIIKEGVNKVHQIAYSSRDNTLYFTFEQLSDVPTRSLGYVNFNSEQTGIIEGVRNATGLAIDRSRNRVYVGGSDGLFFLNEATKVPEMLPVSQDIRYLFFKNVVYFVNNKRQAFKFDSGVVYTVDELSLVEVEKFVEDDDNNLLFLNKNNLFRVKLGTKAVNSHEKYVVSTIAADNFGKPYVSAKNGLYVYNKYKYVLDRISDKLTGLKALTFDMQNNPIYVVNDKIVRLIVNPIPCFGD